MILSQSGHSESSSRGLRRTRTNWYSNYGDDPLPLKKLSWRWGEENQPGSGPAQSQQKRLCAKWQGNDFFLCCTTTSRASQAGSSVDWCFVKSKPGIILASLSPLPRFKTILLPLSLLPSTSRLNRLISVPTLNGLLLSFNLLPFFVVAPPGSSTGERQPRGSFYVCI